MNRISGLRIIAFAVLLAKSLTVFSQMQIGGLTYYGNEWIDYTKDYYKVKVGEDGIYQITGKTLKEAGMNLTGLKPNDLQLWHFGKEIPIRTTGTNTFTESDYLEFYGKRNTIGMDSFMVADWKNTLLNKEYSMLTDTSAYFVTINKSANNKRYTIVNPNYQQHTGAAPIGFMYTVKQIYTSNYFKPLADGSSLKYSNCVKGEGFANEFSPDKIYNISTPDKIDIGKEAILNIRMVNNGIFVNKKNIYFNGKLIYSDTTSTNEITDAFITIPYSELNNENQIRVQNVGINDQHAVSFISIIYPRSTSIGNTDFVNFNGLNIENYYELKSNKPFSFVFDIVSSKIYTTKAIGSSGSTAFLTDATEDRQIIIDANPTIIQKVEKKNFIDLRSYKPNYLIITSDKLYSTDGGNIDRIKQYADYRSSDIGGHFDVYTLMVDQIYDQFGYGLPNNAYSFKNMTHYFDNVWPQLEYVLMLGKGREYRDVRSKAQLEDPLNASFFLPVYGDSPSDNLLFSTGASPKPHFAIGRIAAANMNEIGYYLDKVMAHDAALYAPQDEDKLWLKRIMHMGGGNIINSNEAGEIKKHLTKMKNTIETNEFGGEVFSFYKSSSVAIQNADLAEILKTINSGLCILTFFGHASVGTFDFALDNPSNYKNAGRLPFLFSLGCYSGNLSTNGKGISENFVLTPNVGSIGFIASAGTALLNTQGLFGEDFYDNLGGKYYNQTIGKIFQDIHASVENNTFIPIRTLHQQLTLHSDPAVRLHAFEKPDYIVNYSTIHTLPSTILQSDKEYELSFDVSNLGRNISDSIDITILHLIPNGDTSYNTTIRIAQPGFSQNVKLKIPTPKLNSLGKNSIQIFVESAEKIDEISESNNRAESSLGEEGYTLLFINEGIKPLYPRDFGIVNNNSPLVLKASLTNLFLPINDYLFEIDTTEEFNSPLLLRGAVDKGPSLIEWSPNISLQEGKVYYWRVAIKMQDPTLQKWESSSFIYLAESEEGWNQSHYFQWLKDDLDGILVDRNSTFNFGLRNYTVKVRSEVYRGDIDIPFATVNASKFGSITPFNGTRDNIAVMVWSNKGFFRNQSTTDFGSLSFSKTCFPYEPTTIEGRKGIKALLDAAPDSAYVFVYFFLASNTSDFKVEQWASDSISLGYNLFSVLENYGAQKIRGLQSKGTVPYIFYFKKNLGAINEVIAENKLDQISVTGNPIVLTYEANINSSKIGPAKEWKNLIWTSGDNAPADTIYVNIYKLKSPTSERVFHKKVVLEGTIDLSDIDAATYPYLLLHYDVFDWTNFTAADLDYWRVTYQGFPDLALVADDKFKFHSSAIDQGETLQFQASVKNISSIDVKDSFNIKYTFTDKFNKTIVTENKLKGLNSGESTDIAFLYPSQALTGEYQFLVEANEAQIPKEEYVFNNIGVAMFKVKPDSLNPNMDVTFDGIRIMDGDIVASKPEISIRLKDNNKYLLLDRPDLFTLQLKKSDVRDPINIDLSSPEITFTKATSSAQNEARILYKPALEDGEYKLFVQAKDVTGNLSGLVEYVVNFTVESKKTITNVYNFPNPFTSSTRFVFTLTGQVPDQIKIQIMTTSGKVVREITKAELGNIRVGNNITEYAWDGTDEFGSKLGNGVYFYRMITSQAADFEKSTRDNDNDLAFKNGFGKLVILR